MKRLVPVMATLFPLILIIFVLACGSSGSSNSRSTHHKTDDDVVDDDLVDDDAADDDAADDDAADDDSTDDDVSPTDDDAADDDAACNSNTCSGCCNGVNCLPGNTNAHCGLHGSQCLACPEGKSCENGACVAACNPTLCPSGCCSGTTCKTGNIDGFCGKNGESCSTCGSDQHCVSQECAAACDSQLCPSGCCNGTTCVPLASESDAQCGNGGADCSACSATPPNTQHCASGQCVAACDSGLCANGCCDAETSTCVTIANQTNETCGQAGAACAACPATPPNTEACEAGTCTPACNHAVCPDGCCHGTACEAGTTNAYCGTGGANCAACSAEPPNTQTCDADRHECVAACDGSLCSTGCCNGTSCLPGNTDAACGIQEPCMQCGIGTQHCVNAQCVPACDNSLCPNGCCNNTTCIQGDDDESDSQCGTGGNACAPCTSAQHCEYSAQNGWGCVAACDGTLCPTGCCTVEGDGGTCVTTESDAQCGTNGGLCGPCDTANGYHCEQVTGVWGCVQWCDPTTCPSGCCTAVGQGGTCVPFASQTDAQCGAAGDLCDVCSNTPPNTQHCEQNQQATGGACVAACDASLCSSGCCDGTTCYAGTSDAECGTGATAVQCSACSPTSQHCEPNQTTGYYSCVAACDSSLCPAGCCTVEGVGGVCVAFGSQTDGQCGAAGAACAACSATPPNTQHCEANGHSTGGACAAACDAGLCPNGCCTAVGNGGTCISPPSDTQCESNGGGSTCTGCSNGTQHCTQNNQTWSCVDYCDNTNCAHGCCGGVNGKTCETAETDAECGWAGNVCAVCGAGHKCEADNTGAYSCTAFCDGTDCPNGCCVGATCVPHGQQSASQCGLDGHSCSNCGSLDCVVGASGGQCECDSNVCASGCCTAVLNGSCVAGTSDSQCGTGGGLCTSCTSGSTKCYAKSCTVVGACCNGHNCYDNYVHAECAANGCGNGAYQSWYQGQTCSGHPCPGKIECSISPSWLGCAGNICYGNHSYSECASNSYCDFCCNGWYQCETC